MSEPAYAEWFGDSADLAVPSDDIVALTNLQGSRLPVVVGR
jgi:hypothetical protein